MDARAQELLDQAITTTCRMHGWFEPCPSCRMATGRVVARINELWALGCTGWRRPGTFRVRIPKLTRCGRGMVSGETPGQVQV